MSDQEKNDSPAAAEGQDAPRPEAGPGEVRPDEAGGGAASPGEEEAPAQADAPAERRCSRAGGAPSPTAEGEEDIELEELEVVEPLPSSDEEVAALREQIAELEERVMRKEAEIQNLHRRSQRENARSRAFGMRDLLGRMLPSLDNLERALKDEAGPIEALHKGVELVDSEIKRVLGEVGVRILDPVGEVLDPNLHEAFLRQPHEEAAENVILSVFEKGYCLNEVVIRPARVIVSSGEKPPAPEPAPEAPEAPQDGGDGEENP